MKKILFPTDFSSTAENAYLYALKLAQQMNAELVTLHVYELPDISRVHLPNTIKEIYDSIEWEEFENYKDAVPRLRQLAQENGFEDISAQHVLTEGETIPTIVTVSYTHLTLPTICSV